MEGAKSQIEPLLRRERQRLEQNREAARRFREKKKLQVQKLEDELKHLKEMCNRKEEQQPRPGAVPRETPHALKQLSAWYDKHFETVRELEGLVSRGATEEELVDLVDEGFNELVQRWSLFRDGMVGEAAPGVLEGLCVPKLHRPFLWLGGCRPSQLLASLVFRLRAIKYEESLVFAIESNIISLREKETHLEETFRQLKSSINGCVDLDGVEDWGPNSGKLKQLSLRLHGLWAVASQAEDLRMETIRKLWMVLDVRGRALVVCTPISVMRQLDMLMKSLGVTEM
ncbi:hypothetical protein BSKO_05027 [Bryopsis sp. KO-2023]|nr:hypothetical protein BSKO_05027 [Bryopsis sp. KO-2023]